MLNGAICLHSSFLGVLWDTNNTHLSRLYHRYKHRLESPVDRRRQLSCVQSFMMVFSAQLAEDGGARTPSFTIPTPSTRVMSPPPPPTHRYPFHVS